MKKLIVNFLILFLILCFSYKYLNFIKNKNTELSKEFSVLQNILKRSEKAHDWLNNFLKEFGNRVKISKEEILKIINFLKLKYDLKIKDVKVNNNNVFFSIKSNDDENIISFLGEIFNEKMNLAVILKTFTIQKNENMYDANVRILLPNFTDKIFANKKMKVSELRKCYSKNKNKVEKLGLSLFCNKCIFNGIVNDEVSLNGVWIPKKFENNNFISTMDKNSSIILYVKKLKKKFQLELDKEEIISP